MAANKVPGIRAPSRGASRPRPWRGRQRRLDRGDRRSMHTLDEAAAIVTSFVDTPSPRPTSPRPHRDARPVRGEWRAAAAARALTPVRWSRVDRGGRTPDQTPRTSCSRSILVMTLDDQDRAGARTHRHGARRGAVGAVLDAGHVVAAGDPGGAEEDVLDRDQVLVRRTASTSCPASSARRRASASRGRSRAWIAPPTQASAAAARTPAVRRRRRRARRCRCPGVRRRVPRRSHLPGR